MCCLFLRGVMVKIRGPLTQFIVMDYGSEIDDRDGERNGNRPVYASRQPPLIQPLVLSSFAERTFKKYVARDLAHEWVGLFHVIGGGRLDHRAGRSGSCSSTMKMTIPDTFLLSPTGQPSLWYMTTASKHIKTRRLPHVTPQCILKAFYNGAEPTAACAVVREGFSVRYINSIELEAMCRRMENACIRTAAPEGVEDLVEERASIVGDDMVAGVEDAAASSGNCEDGSIEFATTLAAPTTRSLSAFCLQQYVDRAHATSFVCLWRQSVVDSMAPRMNKAAKESGSVGSPRKPHSLDDIYVTRRAQDASSPNRSTIKLERLRLEHHEDTTVQRELGDLGFDADATVPLLFHMKLLTGEIVRRMNRSCGSARRVVGIACEFFIHAASSQSSRSEPQSSEVYFAALAGIQWQDHSASWETLQAHDHMSRAIAEACVMDTTSSTPKTVVQTTHKKGAVHQNISLALFEELNPRFPSVQSPLIAQNQWKQKSALLPPYVSPRYVGSTMPKMLRGAQFEPLLTPTQADSVNRLSLPFQFQLAPEMPRHPLSKRNTDVERELWERHAGPDVAYASSINSWMKPPRSPKSPRPARLARRARCPSLIKEELQ